MALDQCPVHALAGEQIIDVRIIELRAGLVESELLPVANPRHQLDTEQERQSIGRGALGLGITMQNIGPNIGLVLDQSIQDIYRFPDTAGDEMGEQGDIGIADMVVRDTAIAAVAYMVFGQEVVLVDVPLGYFRPTSRKGKNKGFLIYKLL